MKNMFKKLKGKFVPISKTDKIKLIDANDKEFTFERDLEEDGVNYFREWLKDEMQKYIRKELLG
ncbi:hypothetical protein HER15_14225 [Tenacibaculum mesophilum]|uniref:Uncharacterized protein n=1 Tax=Tenacibaculum mesophilum TaxID=104268 RepID=A0AAE9MQA6_9FLAO|nr:hypothetical protein [Tenacibaculum mesophilum]UTD16562.1 hypothetical protein HER15_14225 [Tenacibaculum mesophilum]